MTEDKQGQSRKRKRLGRVLIVAALVLAALIVPPMVSISRYKSQITRLISTSLGRPVHLASVEARLLPLPGFVLTNLTVDEDPRYGVEPTLHAETVKASIRLLPLWRGKLEIGSISMDEASLNVVRNSAGELNLDALFRTAASKIKPEGSSVAKATVLPSFSAINSRINFKRGAEKLPFSLLNTTLSLSAQRGGAWHFQLKGQPARTDLRLESADTGTLRVDGTAQDAADLRQMALRLDLSWKDAQLGQLSRLLVGSDSGWRGALTGDLHLEGSPESAQIKARLRAKDVHRAEFAPASSLDFDANCSLTYHAQQRAYENLLCDSPIGSGRVRITGERPAGAQRKIRVELDKLPAQAVLDLARTVRSGLAEGVDAAGSISGQLSYDGALAETPAATAKKPSAKPMVAPLTGELTVENLKLSGKALSAPIEVAKVVLTPPAHLPGEPQVLSANAQLPAGAAAPLNVAVRFERKGYHVALRGQAALARARELARLAGMKHASSLDALSGDALNLDLTADGPWLPEPTGVAAPATAAGDRLTGTVNLRNATWKSEALVNPLSIPTATLRFEQGALRWEPVEFVYGPVKGTATLAPAAICAHAENCPLHFHLEFAELDATALQSALLGAQKKGTMLSDLIARFRPASSRDWPRTEGTVHAASLVLGPVTLKNFSAELRMQTDQAEITSFDGSLLGGAVHGKGAVQAPENERSQPSYAVEAEFQNLASASVGQLLGLRFTGGPVNASGKLEATGYRGADLAASAKGNLHFDWKHGAVAGAAVPALSRFDQWTAEWSFAGGQLVTGESAAKLGAVSQPVKAAVSLEDKPKMSFGASSKP